MTVTFTPNDVGTVESIWLASPATGLPRLAVPGAGDVVVVLSAHPDDESLGAGGTIAAAAARGAEVRLVIATDGEASHPDSPTHSPTRLAEIRRDEMRRAADALAPGLVPTLLGLPDGALTRRHDELARRLLEPLRSATHAISTWAGDGHPDHEACAAVVARLAAERPGLAHWQYPIWGWHWAAPEQMPWPGMARLDLDPAARERKRAAVAVHRSQHASLSDAAGDEAILPPHVLTHFDRDFEAFVVTEPVAPAAHAAYFDRLYENCVDPWGLADRFYEQRKRELVLASLPRERFRRAFEPGCATGELTMRLAAHCDEVVAWDGASAAVAQARRRCGRGVDVVRARIPRHWPDGRFDLVVLSEVGYYCTDLGLLVERLRDALTDDGIVVACHWRRPASDHPHTGDAVHAALAAGLRELTRTVHHVETDFLLDVWTRDGRSVAQAEGIVD